MSDNEKVEARPEGIGVSGWKARQERARAKNSHGKTKEEREAIRAARRRLYDQQTLQPEKASKGEAASEVAIDEPQVAQSENESEAPSNEADASPAQGEEEMTREEMIAELKEAGQTVHPSIKDETLVKKVEALRNEA